MRLRGKAGGRDRDGERAVLVRLHSISPFGYVSSGTRTYTLVVVVLSGEVPLLQLVLF